MWLSFKLRDKNLAANFFPNISGKKVGRNNVSLTLDVVSFSIQNPLVFQQGGLFVLVPEKGVEPSTF
jgi:hypothetical protein